MNNNQNHTGAGPRNRKSSPNSGRVRNAGWQGGSQADPSDDDFNEAVNRRMDQ